jgi:hypothetical protein
VVLVAQLEPGASEATVATAVPVGWQVSVVMVVSAALVDLAVHRAFLALAAPVVPVGMAVRVA